MINPVAVDNSLFRAGIMCLLLSFLFTIADGQPSQVPLLVKTNSGTEAPMSVNLAKPLDRLSLLAPVGKRVIIRDGQGKIYEDLPIQSRINFTVRGALGTHTIEIKNKKGVVMYSLQFDVDAITVIDDGGRYSDMFNLFFTSMQTDTGSVSWNGQRYRYFVPWGLDHCHTMKGLKYFYDFGAEYVDLMREAQRKDGMIWSFVQHMPNMDYWRTRDSLTGYTTKIGNKYFVRQPTENHPEYIFVNTIFQCWKASGNDAWMKINLEAARRALNYAMNDKARWSARFGLLKRVYTIDSWDYQVDDKYLPDLGITNTMIMDPVKSKFGVFFGDNTGYSMACNQLAEMYEHAGLPDDAGRFKARAAEIDERLTNVSWGGHFYHHFIEEDSTVKRDLGVDEQSQLAQSNAYSLNRAIGYEKSKAIIESYLTLRKNLPVGSPGEWYAIYPPFERGFELHNAKWQYMNGGVGGHVAGELARGAFENGYEQYAADILERMFELGKKYNNKIYFAYTGSIPPPPPTPVFTPLDLSPYANMDSWVRPGENVSSWMNSQREGDDLRNLPVGKQEFNGIRFDLISAEKNNRKAVVAVSRQSGLPTRIEIPVNKTAGAVYLLHTSSKPESENVSGAISLAYADGSTVTRYIVMGKHLAYWWFSRLETDHSGIAWYGSNNVSRGVGLSWCAIDNPFPEKVISRIILDAALDKTIYTVFAISLSNQKHNVPVNPVSFGGPDNWAAATNMAAMIEGLAGIKNSPATQAYSQPQVSPRWVETATDSVNVCIRYAASKGYVAYQYIHQPAQKQIQLHITGSGNKINCHVLLPDNIKKASTVTPDGTNIQNAPSQVGQSFYVDFTLEGKGRDVIIKYE